MRNNILYIALRLLPWSENVLIESVKKAIAQMESEGEYNKYSIICHHMTIAFGNQITDELYNYSKTHEGEVFPIKVISIGYSDKAIAFGVETECPSANKIKHITLCTLGDGKPVDSNYITNWKPMSMPTDLQGKLTFMYRK